MGRKIRTRLEFCGSQEKKKKNETGGQAFKFKECEKTYTPVFHDERKWVNAREKAVLGDQTYLAEIQERGLYGIDTLIRYRGP